MQVSYSFSQSAIPVSSHSNIDLLVSFSSDANHQTETRRPLNLSLVIDRSGSMAGTPLRNAIQAAQKLVDYLTPEDILSIIVYDDFVETILPPAPVQSSDSIKELLSKISAGGCTNLSGGWLRGCEHVKTQRSTEHLNRVLLLTDGQANVGIRDNATLINTAKEQAEQGIATTTLGFGTYFNEDLLIGMANAAGGNFYFIQSPDDAADVFRIEVESLLAIAAQNLTVTYEPPSFLTSSQLSNYRMHQSEMMLDDVYTTEAKQLAIALSIEPASKVGTLDLGTLTYTYQAVEESSTKSFTQQLPIQIQVDTVEAVSALVPDRAILEQISKFRIAKVKDEAIALADRGDYKVASQTIQSAIADLKLKSLQESFEFAEEIAQLDHYAQRLENGRFDTAVRKEMRDQAYQAQSRDRADLKLRGISAGSADTLERVTEAGESILVKCVREAGKLRVHVISESYDAALNVQFPRSIRQEGVTYTVEEIRLSADQSFYRASGTIKRLVRPGEEIVQNGSSASTRSRKAANAIGSSADLETTSAVGTGVLIHCIKDKSKLRARVVSDGYNPDYNIRFPRNIREEGMLYVVDSVEEVASGGSYIAYGKIRRFVQQ
jgi:Ca-activated chloride channel homolog